MSSVKTKKKQVVKKPASSGSPSKAANRSADEKKRADKGANRLHLPSLTIEGFRGIKKLNLPELGRVTLLMGKNGAGKSTVLEAVKIYASGGAPNVMERILRTRENVLERSDEEGDPFYVPNYGSLFFGHGKPQLGDAIKIGCAKNSRTLEIELSQFEPDELEAIPPQFLSILEAEGFKGLAIFSGPKRKKVGKFPFISSAKREFTGDASRRLVSRIWNQDGFEIPSISHRSLGPGLPPDGEIASWYGGIATTSAEKDVLQALRLINPDIESLASVSGGSRFPRIMRMVAGLKNVDSQIPLKSMGDGIVRLLGLALALVSAKDSFLLLDEAENGIHYELFPKLWDFVMRTAEENNVQVIATTHSWDCVAGFTKASNELKEIKGHAFRIVREGEDTRAVSYTEKELSIAAEGNIEVR